MSQEPSHRMQPGLGVIQWQSRILVYQVNGSGVAWARFLGEPTVEIDEALRAAIAEDQRRAGHN